MSNKKTALLAASVVLTGITLYIACKKVKKHSRTKKLAKRKEHLANVFNYAKKQGGAEFVL